MFAAAGMLVVISGFCGFVVFRLPMAIVAALMTAGLLLVGGQLVNSVRSYRRNRQTQTRRGLDGNTRIDQCAPKVGPILNWP